MRADIIVLSYGNEAYTVRCMRSIRQHTNGYNLVWVDNGSSKESRDVVMDELRLHPRYKTIWLPENTGFVKGNNIALKAILSVWKTGSPYIVLLNNDVEVTPRWLEKLTNVFRQDRDVYAVGPITSECKSYQSYRNAHLVLPVFQEPDGFRELDTNGRAAKLDYCYGDLYRWVNMVAFFCTAFRRETFEAIGLLDEAFGVGLGDDDDYCKRLNDMGLRVAVALGGYVFHNHRTTFTALYDGGELAEMGKDRKQVFARKHGEEAKVHAL